MQSRQAGIALVMVVAIVAILTIIALTLTTVQRTQIALTRNDIEGVRFRAHAEGLLNLVAAELLTARSSGFTRPVIFPSDGQWHAFAFDGRRFLVRLQDESGLVPINSATREQLARLIDLVAVGEVEFDPEILADRILDARDPDDLRRAQGAEDDDYRSAGLPYGAADEPFGTLGALRQVPGMSDALYARLVDHLSVDNRAFNPAHASSVALAAWENLNLADASARVAQRGAIAQGGPLYRIDIVQGDVDQSARRFQAVFELGSMNNQPFTVHWRRLGLPSPVQPQAVSI